MPVLIALVVFFAVTAAVAAATAPRENLVQRRIENLRGVGGSQVELPDIDRPFGERVLAPMVAWFGRRLELLIPSSMVGRLEAKLTTAGSPLSARTLLAVWGMLAVGLPLLIGVLVLPGKVPINMKLLYLVVTVLIGAYGPYVWLNGRVRRRQTRVIKALPDSMDLVVTCVEAGLGVDAALSRVVEKVESPFSDELRRALREMALGRSRRDALHDIAVRTQVPDVSQLVNAMIQAETMGVSLGQVIRVQADQMRTRRRQRAEEQAYKAPVKMVFPLVLFIFPSMFIVILGPAAIQIYHNLVGK